MREYSVPANFTVPDDWSCSQPVEDWYRQEPGKVVFQKIEGTEFVPVTAEEFRDDVRATSKGLMAKGVGTGDRVAILANTRYEWTVLDFANWTAGAVTIPIFESSSADQIRWILEDSAAGFLFVETAAHFETAAEGAEGLDTFKEILLIEGEQPAVDALRAAGADISDEDLEERRRTVNADDPATLVYTSGTTGRPKGVVLTHRNFQAETLSLRETKLVEYLHDDSDSVMFLPLAHVFARTLTYFAFYCGAKLTLTSDLANIVDIFGRARPQFIISVPRVFEKVFTAAQAKAQDGGRLRAAIFKAATDTAVEYSKADGGESAGPLLRLRHALFSKLVYNKIIAALGGNCELAVSGGAALGERLGHFFAGIGLNIFEGYGLTETSAAICVNTPGANRIGTVGQPIPGHAVRIAEDGEAEVWGPVVAAGYWQNEEATAEAFNDGWFSTGDLGTLDEDGFLRIIGRKKEIIVTAGGKNVAPNTLEDGLRADPLVAEAVVLGDRMPFISALITVDPDAFERWKKQSDKTGSLEELRTDPDLVAHMDAAVADANRAVSKAESVRKYTILTSQFTEESGELTPSLKIKRRVVHSNYADEIESIYAG